jgi:hypothetical protein
MSSDASKCRAIIPPSTEACGADVTHRVTFKDGDRVLVCIGCSMHFQQVAMGHGFPHSVKVERLADLPVEKR